MLLDFDRKVTVIAEPGGFDVQDRFGDAERDGEFLGAFDVDGQEPVVGAVHHVGFGESHPEFLGRDVADDGHVRHGDGIAFASALIVERRRVVTSCCQSTSLP
jgi:hypothetical protein